MRKEVDGDVFCLSVQIKMQRNFKGLKPYNALNYVTLFQF